MKSEITKEFVGLFRQLPERVQRTARKNYRLWKQNPNHPSVEFKRLDVKEPIYSVRVGIGWRALGVKKPDNSMVWFWIGSHAEYDHILERL